MRKRSTRRRPKEVIRIMVKRIQFVGKGKCRKYVGGDPVIHCFIDVPESCILTVGVNVTYNQAWHLMRDHSDIFIALDANIMPPQEAKEAEPEETTLSHEEAVTVLTGDDWTVKRLKALAEEKSIDLTGVTLKTDIAEVIVTAMEEDQS